MVNLVHSGSIRIDVHYWYHTDGASDEQLASIQASLASIKKSIQTIAQKEGTVTVQLDALRDEVARTRSVEESARVMIAGIAARLEASDSSTNADIQQIISDLRTGTDPLASAVTENTPAAGGGGGTTAPTGGEAGTAGPTGGAPSETGGAPGPTETGGPGGTTDTAPGGESGQGTQPPA